VRLAFDLPVRSHARLEVFDAQGRRVRRIDGDYAPGRHAFEWDLRHADGARVAPGIYTYRLTAGAFRAHKKLVVLP
jgi:flagellar hook assembly protein FlgD